MSGDDAAVRMLAGSAGLIAVEEHGGGASMPVVLLHGMAGDATFWQDVIAAFGDGRRIIVPELRGHGRSAAPDNADHSIESHAGDVLAVADQLGLTRFVLVGHSFGASVALEVAGRAPGRVAGLVVADGAGDFTHVPEMALAGFVDGLASDADYEATVEGAFDVALAGSRPETERRVRAAILAAPRSLVRSVYRALLAYRPTDALDRYPGPVLLITAPANAASFALHALRPLVPRHSFNRVSHWLMMDEPHRFASVVMEFMDTRAL